MKVFAVNTGGNIWKGAIFKTKKLATNYILAIEPTCKKQRKRSKFSGCEVFDNEAGKTFCIETLNVRTK